MQGSGGDSARLRQGSCAAALHLGHSSLQGRAGMGELRRLEVPPGYTDMFRWVGIGNVVEFWLPGGSFAGVCATGVRAISTKPVPLLKHLAPSHVLHSIALPQHCAGCTTPTAAAAST